MTNLKKLMTWHLLVAALVIAFAGMQTTAQSNDRRLVDGHLMRRIGFGPTPSELEQIGRVGNLRYIIQQLSPETVDDREFEAALARLQPESNDPLGYVFYPQRWYFRMIHSRRQLLEKMTLVWHEHFATSVDKAGMLPQMLAHQEETLRRNSLGSFRQMLIEITQDPAMLIWLDNNENNGRGEKAPNENYARELMQLFALGTQQLNLDGSIKRDQQGRAIPAYHERDIKELARALTGWTIYYDENAKRFFSAFNPLLHDIGEKTVLGRQIAGRAGADGAHEIEDAVDILMAQPTMAPFIAKILIQKFATQTPTPRFVARVAQTFLTTGGNLRMTMFALLADREFSGPEVIRSQPKTPIEHFAGMLRSLEAHTQGRAMVETGYALRYLIFYPPTVFGFYPPGEKERLLQTDLMLMRDNLGLALLYTAPGNETWIDLSALFRKYEITGTPAEIVDKMSDLLMQASLEPRTRSRIIKFISNFSDLNEDVLKVALWLILCSPDYQLN